MSVQWSNLHHIHHTWFKNLTLWPLSHLSPHNWKFETIEITKGGAHVVWSTFTLKDGIGMVAGLTPDVLWVDDYVYFGSHLIDKWGQIVWSISNITIDRGVEKMTLQWRGREQGYRYNHVFIVICSHYAYVPAEVKGGFSEQCYGKTCTIWSSSTHHPTKFDINYVHQRGSQSKNVVACLRC